MDAEEPVATFQKVVDNILKDGWAKVLFSVIQSDASMY